MKVTHSLKLLSQVTQVNTLPKRLLNIELEELEEVSLCLFVYLF